MPTLFLDRDGVIIENRADYVRSVAEVVFIPDAVQAIARATQAGWRIVVVTNQAGIGRGVMARATVEAINAHIITQVKRGGGSIEQVYVCPHRPDEDCACRKPKPGLLLQAARELNLDLSAAVMVGDSFSDVQAAQAAGVRPVFVQSGLPERLAQEQAQAQNAQASVYANLSAAVAALLMAEPEQR